MRATILNRPGQIVCEEVADPKIQKATDAIVRLSVTCVCGSDLWSYRGIQPVESPQTMGHEYCGVVEKVGGNKTGRYVLRNA